MLILKCWSDHWEEWDGWVLGILSGFILSSASMSSAMSNHLGTSAVARCLLDNGPSQPPLAQICAASEEDLSQICPICVGSFLRSPLYSAIWITSVFVVFLFFFWWGWTQRVKWTALIRSSLVREVLPVMHVKFHFARLCVQPARNALAKCTVC